MEPSPWKNFETLQLHAGYEPDPVTRSTAVPIYATSVRQPGPFVLKAPDSNDQYYRVSRSMILPRQRDYLVLGSWETSTVA